MTNCLMLPQGSSTNGISSSGGDQPHQIGRKDHHHGRGPETGDRYEDDGDAAPDVVTDAVLADGGIDAYRQGDDERDDEGDESELERGGQPVEDPTGDGVAAVERSAEVALRDDAKDPSPVLDDQRDVQAEVLFQSLPTREGVPGPAHHDVYDVAGNEAKRHKDEHRHDEERRNYQQHSSYDVVAHFRIRESGRSSPEEWCHA